MTHPIRELAQCASIFSPFTGDFDESSLESWLSSELIPPLGTRLIFPETIVHIISGNTPHAAWQSLLRGLLLGAKNHLKLPAHGLLEFEASIANLPTELQKKIKTSRTLPSNWIPEADALVCYGSDSTLAHFRTLTPLEIPFIAHGHRIGVALIQTANEEAASLAAKDICEFDQAGCLSLQTIFVNEPRLFAPLLAAELQKYPRQIKLTPSEHGAITNFRHEHHYLEAQEPENFALWVSEHSTDWTIVLRDTPELLPSPGNRTIILKPYDRLQPSRQISGIGLYPFNNKLNLPSPRLFPLGQAQCPPFGWAHDGIQPLRSLVRVQTY